MAGLAAWFWLALAIGTNISANLLLKIAVTTGEAPATGLSKWALLAIGIGCAGVLLVSYVLALRHLPVSLAYPIVTGCAMVGIGIMSAPLLGESLNLTKCLGIGAILLGCTLLAQQG